MRAREIKGAREATQAKGRRPRCDAGHARAHTPSHLFPLRATAHPARGASPKSLGPPAHCSSLACPHAFPPPLTPAPVSAGACARARVELWCQLGARVRSNRPLAQLPQSRSRPLVLLRRLGRDNGRQRLAVRSTSRRRTLNLPPSRRQPCCACPPKGRAGQKAPQRDGRPRGHRSYRALPPHLSSPPSPAPDPPTSRRLTCTRRPPRPRASSASATARPCRAARARSARSSATANCPARRASNAASRGSAAGSSPRSSLRRCVASLSFSLSRAAKI